jgi:hypothetical protein
MTAVEAAAPSAATGSEGRVAAWVRGDRVRAVAVALILVQLAWRPQVAARGFLAFDDFTLASKAAGSHLTFEFVTTLYNNHFMPGGLAASWLVSRAFGLEYWPYVVLMTACQAAVSIAFYRLLRQLVPLGWGLLVPLALFLFCPLTLEADSWWAVGANVLPMQLAIILAIGAQIRYVRTRHPRHLVSLGLSFLLGLLFFEKSLLIAPLVFLLTACLFVEGGPVRSVLRAAVRYRQSWAVLLGVGGAYFALYLTRAQSSLYPPSSVGEVLTFLRQMLFSTLIPGMFGGPWRWAPAGDGASDTAPGDIGRWLALAALVALIVVTALIRRGALRVWVVPAVYVAMVAAMLAMTRLGRVFSPAAGLAPRYVADALLVAVLCLGIAMLGLRETPDHPEAAPAVAARAVWPAGFPPALRTATAATTASLVLLGGYLLGAAWSTERFGDLWSVKDGRDFLRTAEADLAALPPGTEFLDLALPEKVQSSLSYPYNLDSQFFLPARHRPVFVTESEDPWIFDKAGHAVHANVGGNPIKPSHETACGYVVHNGEPTRMPLSNPQQWEWLFVVKLVYLSSGESQAHLSIGKDPKFFTVYKGVHTIFFLVEATGPTVEMTVEDSSVTLCTNEITIGNAVPRS